MKAKTETHEEDAISKIDVYEVRYGPHRGRVRWTLSIRGVVVDSDYEETEQLAYVAASRRLAQYPTDARRKHGSR